MSNTIKICPKCKETGANIEKWKERNRPQDFCDYNKGIIGAWWIYEDGLSNCYYCNTPLVETNVSKEDFHDIAKASNNNRQLLEAMIELKKKDIIEYELKMGQFRTQVQQQKIAKQQSMENKNIPRCPTCNSTNLSKISNVKKATKIGLFGIFGAGDIGKTWKCNNCGSKF